MHHKIQAIKEAISFIRVHWIGKSNHWEGHPEEFVGATIFADVSTRDIKSILGAIRDGEPIPVDGFDGLYEGDRLVKVRVSK